MVGKVLGGFVIIFLLFTIGTTPIVQGVHNWRTQEITQSVVLTTTDNTTAPVVLSEDLFANQPSEIETITSTLGETPVATAYASATNTLTISALTAHSTRTLTLTFYAPVDDPIMTGIGPFITPLIFILIVGAVVWAVFGTNKRRG
jgi:hypothetical protein